MKAMDINKETENKVAYIIAVINEFASTHSLNNAQAYRYLERFKGLDFVNRFYNVEHTFSFEDVVNDLTAYCHRKGGALVWLYHGSNMDIREIDLSMSKVGKDFGCGFYLSADKEQAFELAERKTEQLGIGIPTLNAYDFDTSCLNNNDCMYLNFKTTAKSGQSLY